MIFRTYIIMTNLPVRGKYKYNDTFQILPAMDLPQPPAGIGAFPCILEIKYNTPQEDREYTDGTKVPIWIIENEYGRRMTNEICLLFSALSTNYFFQYSVKQSWYTSQGVKGKEKEFDASEWGQEFYSYSPQTLENSDFTISTHSDVNFLESNIYYGGLAPNEPFDLPEVFPVLLDNYFNLEDNVKKIFLSACSLFHQGIKLWSDHPSLSFAAFVSSIETLVQYENRNRKIEKCSECGQERYQVVKKFSDFFHKYGSPSNEFKKFSIKVYKYRSNILHKGLLFLGEIEPVKYGKLDWVYERDILRNVIYSSRICFVNWLNEKTSI